MSLKAPAWGESHTLAKNFTTQRNWPAFETFEERRRLWCAGSLHHGRGKTRRRETIAYTQWVITWGNLKTLHKLTPEDAGKEIDEKSARSLRTMNMRAPLRPRGEKKVKKEKWEKIELKARPRPPPNLLARGRS